MASFELREPKKKPRYYKLIANVLVNGKIERRYGRFDFDLQRYARAALCEPLDARGMDIFTGRSAVSQHCDLRLRVSAVR